MATGGGSKGPKFEVHVMGHPKQGAEGREGQLGACPYSHRVLLVLEEREIPYTLNYIDVTNKSEWVSEASPQGTLPIIKDLSSGQFIPDSDAISDFVEDKFSEQKGQGRSLRKVADCPQPAPQLWPRSLAYLQAKPGSQEEESAKKEVRKQLQMVEAAATNKSPYIGGKDVCSWDCALAPRLYLARQACKLLKGWDFCEEEFEDVKAYLHRMGFL